MPYYLDIMASGTMRGRTTTKPSAKPASSDEAAVHTTLLRQNVCPRCGQGLLGPDWSELVDERCIRHHWSCELCGFEGELAVYIDEAIGQVPAVRVRPSLIDALLGRGFSEKEIFTLVLPKRTLARRRSTNKLLTVEETDKALRLKRIADLAELVFSDAAKAHRWMRQPKRALSGETPLAYLASENGGRVVEEMLRRIEHGIFA